MSDSTENDREALRAAQNEARAAAYAAGRAEGRREADAALERVRALVEMGVREQWPPDEWRAGIFAVLDTAPTPTETKRACGCPCHSGRLGTACRQNRCEACREALAPTDLDAVRRAEALADRWDAELRREYGVGEDYTSRHARELRATLAQPPTPAPESAALAPTEGSE